MRRHEGGQTDQGEVLDDCYHVISVLGLSARDFHFRNCPLVTLLHLLKLFLTLNIYFKLIVIYFLDNLLYF